MSEDAGAAGENTQETLERSEAETKNSVKQWLYRRSMFWVVVFLILLFIAAGSLRIYRSEQHKLVRARRDLVPYTIVREDDLEEIPGFTHVRRAVSTKAEAVGQITLVLVPRDKTVTEDMLYKPSQQTQLKDWEVLSVPLGAMPGPDIGEIVRIVALQQGEKKATTLFDEALALGTKGDQVVLAVPRDTAEAAAISILSNKQLLVLRSLRY